MEGSPFWLASPIWSSISVSLDETDQAVWCAGASDSSSQSSVGCYATRLRQLGLQRKLSAGQPQHISKAGTTHLQQVSERGKYQRHTIWACGHTLENECETLRGVGVSALGDALQIALQQARASEQTHLHLRHRHASRTTCNVLRAASECCQLTVAGRDAKYRV